MTTAKPNDAEPQAWMTDALQCLTVGHPTNRIDELLPWNRPPCPN
ncbi:transposase domain-containing protein [Sinisalibacter aestuarii]